jgi:peptidoglycan/xylan/chitin deacetylase (PgdA/CDA1 family)
VKAASVSARAGRNLILLTTFTAFAACLSGCNRKPAQVAQAEPAKPKAKPQVSDVDLKSYKPNEAGAVMVLMYHRILPNESDNPLNRKPETFRKDLELLYEKKYHPVTAREFVTNTMDVPAGKTPVVITFDDALVSQFKVVAGKSGGMAIDPDCAVGIMETFSKEHPDWPLKATFFVLPKEGGNGAPFGQEEMVADKLEYLVSKGYEVANHTSTHKSLRRMASDKIKWEVATAVRDIQEINPKATMDTLALPYGQEPTTEGLTALKQGEEGGTSYANKAVFLAAWRPVLAPITKDDKKFSQAGKLCTFNPYALERITPDPSPKAGQTFEYWLKFFDDNPGLRYVSDGNAEVVSVPKSHADMVDAKRVEKQGKVLQAYSFGGGAGSSGSSLSVE